MHGPQLAAIQKLLSAYTGNAEVLLKVNNGKKLEGFLKIVELSFRTSSGALSFCQSTNYPHMVMSVLATIIYSLCKVLNAKW